MTKRIYAAALAVSMVAVAHGATAAEAQRPDPKVPLAADHPRPAPNEIVSVPAAAPGVFSARKEKGGTRLVVKGRKFTSRAAIENYLAYRAAEEIIAQDGEWFMFVESRQPGDGAPALTVDAQLRSFSFRMPNFRPVWRYKTVGSGDWQTWSPFSGAAFFGNGIDPATVAEYEVTATIVPGKGLMNGRDPLAFHAIAVSDFLVNQVAPPQ